MQEIRTYEKTQETGPDRLHGVMVPVGTRMRVAQEQGAADMEMEGWERVKGDPSCTCKLCRTGYGPGQAPSGDAA